MKVSPFPAVIFALAFSAVVIFPSGCKAIECYRCKSEDSKECTAKKPSGETFTAVNCSNPNKLLNDWILSHDFMKAGIGDINIEKGYNAASDETAKESELKNVTACAFLFASSENKVTAEVDKGIEKVRSTFGDDKASESVTVQTWVMRDCVTITSREETKDETNRCVPVPGTKDVAKLQFCTCTTDKCNYPDEKVGGFIADAAKANSVAKMGAGMVSKAGLILVALGVFAKLVESF